VSASQELPESVRARIPEVLARHNGNKTAAARELGIRRGTVKKWAEMMGAETPLKTVGWPESPVPPQAVAEMRQAGFSRLPDPAPLAGGPSLPEPFLVPPLKHLHCDNAGWWLVLGDMHFPMHDKTTIELAFKEAREKNAVGVLLNGDVMDMFNVTPFRRPPTKEDLADEIECGRSALAWMRSRLPKARFVYREGNHDYRLRSYIIDRAPALFQIEAVRLPNLLGLADHGIEWVQDKAKVYLGKLITLHGHEFRKGEGVNPARLAFLRATATVLVNHHHRSSEHLQRSLDDKHFAAWSVGCACYKHPDYDPYNQWNHGYAMVELGQDGWYSVHNRKVIEGRVV
jgi:predicted phosphodiesterase